MPAEYMATSENSKLCITLVWAPREILLNCLCGMKRKAHGTQKPRHINRIVEVASAAQRSDSPAQAINQGFPRHIVCVDRTARVFSATPAYAPRAAETPTKYPG